MSFKIKQNGVVKDLKLPAASIEVLDMEDNYTTNNLEEVLQELGESDSIYISDNEPDKDGVWISNENIAQTGENKTFNALKDYIEENITPKVNSNEVKINQISNNNLLINGDFQVWSKGTSFSDVINSVYTADKWRYRKNTGSHAIEKVSNGVKISTLTPGNDTIALLEYVIEDKDHLNWNGKTLTLSIKVDGEIYFYTFLKEDKKMVRFRNGVFSVIDSGNNVLFDISYTLNSTKTHFVIEWVKLELGVNPTPFIPKPYVQELQDCLMYNDDKLTTPYSNPNLLINGDFQVWQRGNSFTNISNQYTADRWKLYANSNTINVAQEGYSTRITTTTDNSVVNFWQVIETPTAIRNQKVTLSFIGRASQEIDLMCAIGLGKDFDGATGRQEKLVHLTTEMNNRYSVTFDLPNFTITDNVVVVFRYAGLKGDIWLAQCKLELGIVATPFTPRLYGEELALCQRYYEIVGYVGKDNGTTDSVNMSIPYKVTKRIFPSRIDIGSEVWSGKWIVHPVVLTSYNSDKFCFCSVTKPPSGTANIIDFNIKVSADAEIY